MGDPRGWEALTQQEAEQDARRRDAEAFDSGVEAVRGEIVCSVCGENHDRDESAACDGCDPLRFDEWVEKVRAERDQARDALQRSENDWMFLFNLTPGLALRDDVRQALAAANLKVIRAALNVGENATEGET